MFVHRFFPLRLPRPAACLDSKAWLRRALCNIIQGPVIRAITRQSAYRVSAQAKPVAFLFLG